MSSHKNLLEIRDVTKYISIKTPDKIIKKTLVANISFEIERRGSFGLFGFPGCGKSTLMKLIQKELAPDNGQIVFDGQPLSQLNTERLNRLVKHVFNTSSPKIDGTKTFLETVEACAKNGTAGTSDKNQIIGTAKEVAGFVKLLPELDSKDFDHKIGTWFGVDTQRKMELAVALVSRPKLLIIDQFLGSTPEAQMENLAILREIKDKLGLTYLFVQEDVWRFKELCSTIAIMFLGEIVEIGRNTEEILHPHSKQLLELGLKRDFLSNGHIPTVRGVSMLNPLQNIPGCQVHPICPMYIGDICRKFKPKLKEVANNHFVSCHLFG